MVDITAEVVLDSISSNGGDNARLLTVRCRYPKFIHGEHLRHRAFSFSVSSSRAIPVAKNLEEVRSDDLRAGPVWWGREQKGMQSGEELPDIKNPDNIDSEFYRHGRTELETAQNLWKIAAHYAESCAERMAQIGAHKSIVNRILEPFLHVNVLVTGTTPGWMNFFGLRLDRAAQPEIRALAEACWRVWNCDDGHIQQTLRPGEWHLPYADDELSLEEVTTALNSKSLIYEVKNTIENRLDLLQKLSVARCAHLSYESFETGTRMTVEHCLRIYDRLVGSVPIHASPAEHQATPDECIQPPSDMAWRNPSQAGNLGLGWRQLRKMLPGEAIAPLPEGYR